MIPAMKAAIIAGCVVFSVQCAALGAHANPDGLYPKPVKTQKFQGLPAKKPPYVTRECITKFLPDGKFENEREARNCVKNWNATITNPSKGRWQWVFPPPPEYDIPYTGVLMIQRLPIEQVHKVCAPTRLACAMVVSTIPDPNGGPGRWRININGNRAACLIIMPSDDYIRQHTAQDPKETLRHETGHCNGWPADHPRSQSKWKWVEKTPTNSERTLSCDPYEEAMCPFDDDYSRSQVERNMQEQRR